MTMIESGVPWIGKIPYEWMIRPVKALYSLTTGFTPSSENDSLYDDEGETWVTISDMKSDVVTDSKQKIAKSVAEQHRKDIAKAGSLLYSFKLSVGTVAFAGKDLFTNEAIAAFQPKTDNADLRYLKYASSLIVGNANTNIYGATIMNQKLILNAPLPLPPLEEQRAIYNYLDDRCAKLDEIITEAEKSIEEYKELKQAVIFEAVTKGLDKNVPMKGSGFHWVGDIPSHWKMMKLKYLLEKSDAGIKVGPFGSSFTNKTVGDGDYLIYGQANVISRDFSKTKNSVTADVYHTLSRYDVVSGDICLSVIGNGTIGWCCTVPENIKPGIMDSHLMKIRLNDLIINEFFELYYSKHYAGVCHTQMQYEKTGIAMEGLNTRIVKGLWMAVPPVEEQQEIVEKMMPFIKNMDAIISEKQSLIEDLKAYKKSLIYEVVTGKRRIS